LLRFRQREYRRRPGANTLKSVIHRRVIIQYDLLPLVGMNL
jgi:hypothetical protein